MGALDDLLKKVQDSVVQHTSNQPGFDPSNLLGHITDLFGKHADNNNTNNRNVRPASEDPYGDPANQRPENVKPASQDPYGDPADQQPRRRTG